MKNFTAITIGYEHNKKSLNVIRYGRVPYDPANYQPEIPPISRVAKLFTPRASTYARYI